MILEVFVVISLIWTLYRLQTISNQNDRVLEMVNSMQSQYDNIEQKIELLVSRKLTPDISHLDNTEPLEQSVADILKNMKLSTLDSAVKSGLVVPEVNKSISQIEESNLKLPIHKERFRINAADYLKGASVDSARSSSSNLKPLIGYDQSNLVLLDRPEPPADRAWCTNDENPILTIKLAKYIKPISVSYQHSKWNGTIPNGAPKTYDVVACLDCADGEWEPLAMNCQYSHYESNVKEQMCNVSSNFDLPSIRKVQFRFRENYGNSEWTCVHLVRVYGETKTPVKIEEKNRNSEEICTDLTWYYHNNHFKYTWTEKNCTVLYKNNCCSECPECCQECLITDYNKNCFAHYLFLLPPFIYILFPLGLIISACCRNIIGQLKVRFKPSGQSASS